MGGIGCGGEGMKIWMIVMMWIWAVFSHSTTVAAIIFFIIGPAGKAAMLISFVLGAAGSIPIWFFYYRLLSDRIFNDTR